MQESLLDASESRPLKLGQTHSIANTILGVLLVVLAVLGNVFNVDMFFGVNFLFGSVFAWVALLTIGPAWGLSAIMLASLYTVVLWDHWYAVPLLVGEFVFVIAFSGNKQVKRLIGLSAAYWAFLACPFILYFYTNFLGLPWETVSLVVVKTNLNAIINACLGLLLFHCSLAFRLRLPRPQSTQASFANFLQILFISTLLVPLIAFEFYAFRHDFHMGIQQREERLRELSSAGGTKFPELLKSETLHWKEMFAQDADQNWINAYTTNHNDLTQLGIAPISAYHLAGDSKNLKLLSGKKDQIFENLHSEILLNQDFAPGTLIGCLNNAFLTVSGGADKTYFIWPLESLVPFVGTKINEINMNCRTSWQEVSPDQGSKSVAAPVVMIEQGKEQTYTTLQAWLNSRIKGSVQLNAGFATTLEVSRGLKPYIISVQDKVSFTFWALYLFAFVMVIVSYAVDKLLHVRFEKYTYLVQKFLNDRKIDMEVVNLGITEDQAIYNSLLSLSDSFTEEESARKVIVDNFYQLIEDSSAPIFATDDEGRIKFWNANLESITGFCKEDVIGVAFQKFASVDVGSVMAENEETELEFEFTIETKEGKFINLTASQTILRDLSSLVYTTSESSDDQETLHFFVAQDQTEAVNARAHMVHMSRLAALGEMASAFAHELTQPLNVISMAAGNSLQRINQGTVPSEYLRDKFKRIEDQAQRAGKVIWNIREFSVTSHDDDVEIFDAGSHCKVALDIVREQFRLSSINLAFDDNSEGALIEGRPILFEQVIINLLNNSRQAMLHGNGNGRKCTLRLECEHGFVTIEISDTGPGFIENSISKAFEPYFTTKSDQYGTGIGLYMSKTIVKAMGGKIWAHNGNVGAVVTIKIPIAPNPINGSDV